MKQQELPGLVVDTEKFVGMTDWALASEVQPARQGWYKTRRKSAPNMMQPQRRFWNAALGFFSLPVQADYSDIECAALKTMPSPFSLDDIEWCGLKSKHPDSL